MLNEYETSDEHQPVMWLRGYPVYAAHFIVIVLVASMLITTLLNLLGVGAVLSALVFTSGQVLHGEIWRVVTYGLVNEPSLWFVLSMLMLVWFGRDVERSLGRRTFLIFYGCAYLLTPLLFTLLGLRWPSALAGQPRTFALFIAFATLHPDAPMFALNITAKWVAAIMAGIYALIALNNRDPLSLVSLLATTGFAFAFIRYQQGRIELPQLNLFRRGPKLRLLPDLKKGDNPTTKTARQTSSMAEVDALLDKIAQSGMGSLTTKERAKLDAARDDLLKRDSGRR